MANPKAIRTRKRISRAGSGGYSIYLPKQWINSWTEEQNKDRLVDMIGLGDHLILTPKIARKRISVSSEEMSNYELKQYIVSSYVNGADEFRLTSNRLSDSLIGESRNIIRLLDENLTPGSTNFEISYSNQSNIVHDTDTLFNLLFDKVTEGENLAIDLLTCFDVNPKKGIQILRLMYALEEEDIDRLAFQTLRTLARCDSSSRTISDLNVKWMATDSLERIGDNLYAIAGLVSASYGLEREMLQYPVEYLQEHVLKDGARVPKDMAGLKEHCVMDMRTCSVTLHKVKEMILKRDGRKATESSKDICEYRHRRERDYWKNLGRLSRLSSEVMNSVSWWSMIERRIGEMLYLTEGMTKRAGLVYFADDSS